MDDYDELFGLQGIEDNDAALDKMARFVISGFNLWVPDICVKIIANKTDDEWASEMVTTLDLGAHMKQRGYDQADLADAVARYRARLNGAEE